MKYHILIPCFILSVLLLSCAGGSPKQESDVVQTCAEAYPERFVGVEAAGRKFMDKEYYEKFEALARDGKAPWEYDDFLQRFDPLRCALEYIIGEDKFAFLFTYYGVADPIEVKSLAREFSLVLTGR